MRDAQKKTITEKRALKFVKDKKKRNTFNRNYIIFNDIKEDERKKKITLINLNRFNSILFS